MKVLLMFTMLFGPFCCFSQAQNRSFSEKKLPTEIKIQKKELPDINIIDFFDLTEVLPVGYVQNGTVDYTNELQDAIKKYKKLKFPNFPVLINENGLSFFSDSKVYFPEKSVLVLTANSQENYEVLRLHNISNVELYNPVIVGDRDSHKGTTGEWGMGISIRASDAIRIYNPIIEKCWGDGVYLGHLNNKQVEDVSIFNAYLNNNRRNGISITSGSNVLLDHPIVLNTVGTSPQSGIVIEPSNSKAVLNGVILKNAYTFNNYRSGIQIGGFDLLINSSTEPINIDIINPIDNGSDYGMFIGRVSNYNDLPGKDLSGTIKIINPEWKNNIDGTFTKRKQYGRGLVVQLLDLSQSVKKELWRAYKYDKDVEFE